ncbi:MAG TPA: hypothetical protein VGF65_11685 [Mycobacterium sp.]|jgi:hypothetical protein
MQNPTLQSLFNSPIGGADPAAPAWLHAAHPNLTDPVREALLDTRAPELDDPNRTVTSVTVLGITGKC